MEDTTHATTKDPSQKADHLCVLVHGLWGNTQHLKYIHDSLQERYTEDQLVILACERNTTFYTYDGVEIGGERVAKEIEDTLEQLERDGHRITKLSIVGYSMGGLFARYAVGLLDHKGYFDRIKPVNFTTIASPHLGARTPLNGYANQLFNVLGARALSATGKQVFAVDDFRDTGRPLLSVMADPDSIFIRALRRFERRTLYANIVNDRLAVYYTTGVSRTDPYTSLDKLKLNYVKGYEPVVLDESCPCEVLPEAGLPSFYQRLQVSSATLLRRIPIYMALTIFIPIGVVLFSANATVQTFRSRRRIMLHETDHEGQGFGLYRIPYLFREVRAGLEDAFESANAAQQQDYLPPGSEEAIDGAGQRRVSSYPPGTDSRDQSLSSNEKASGGKVSATRRRRSSIGSRAAFPTLALTPEQFEMIRSLDEVGFKKYPVHIHNSNHSHAAIIVRTPRAAFDEGKIVIKHWLDNEFSI